MNKSDSTESIYIQQPTQAGEMLALPGYPNPPGGRVPDLNLAGESGWPNTTGASIQVMPDPGHPMPYEPVLYGSPDMGGYEPTNPAPCAPNLAGVDGTPQVSALMNTRSNWSISDVIQPDYGEPDWASLHPAMQSFNFQAPGITLDAAGEFMPDPLLPDLTKYNQPCGLDIHNIIGTGPALFRPDPLVADLIDYNVPNGVDVLRDPLLPDPNLPDLQVDEMQLVPDVVMSERPGELDGSALDAMHVDQSYKDQAGLPYNRSFVDQSGMNTTRRRRMDLMMHGLDAEEK